MEINDLTKCEKELLIAALEHYGASAGPAPTKANLKYFTKPHAIKTLNRAMPNMQAPFQALAKAIIEKLEVK